MKAGSQKYVYMSQSQPRLGGLSAFGPSSKAKNPLIKDFGEALRKKISQRMNSFIQKKATEINFDDDINVIETNASPNVTEMKTPDKIIMDVDSAQDTVLDLIDPEFY